jgi:Phage integrase family
VVRVERSWDPVKGPVDVKTGAGHRAVPMAFVVRRELIAHQQRTNRDDEDLVFGRTPTEAFFASTIRARANKAWTAAGLEPITPHEARHCAISYFIAAGLDWKQISTWAGHGDVRQTWNRYGYLIPGGEQAAAARLDAYLEPPDAKLELVPEPPTTADDRHQTQPRQNATPDRTGDPTVAHTVAHPPQNAKSPVNTGDSEYRYRDSNPVRSRCPLVVPSVYRRSGPSLLHPVTKIGVQIGVRHAERRVEQLSLAATRHVVGVDLCGPRVEVAHPLLERAHRHLAAGGDRRGERMSSDRGCEPAGRSPGAAQP